MLVNPSRWRQIGEHLCYRPLSEIWDLTACAIKACSSSFQNLSEKNHPVSDWNFESLSGLSLWSSCEVGSFFINGCCWIYILACYACAKIIRDTRYLSLSKEKLFYLVESFASIAPKSTKLKICQSYDKWRLVEVCSCIWNQVVAFAFQFNISASIFSRGPTL